MKNILKSPFQKQKSTNIQFFHQQKHLECYSVIQSKKNGSDEIHQKIPEKKRKNPFEYSNLLLSNYLELYLIETHFLHKIASKRWYMKYFQNKMINN